MHFPSLSWHRQYRSKRQLPARRLKTQMLTEKRDHVILNAIGGLARVSALVHLEAVHDSVLVKNIVQFGGIDA
jgi:hypothetical protein